MPRERNSWSVKLERAQAEDFKKRAIALKDSGFMHHANLFFAAAEKASAKADILHRIEQLKIQARLNRRRLNRE